MPKAAPTQVIVHRIELQQTERELVEQLIAVQGASQTIVGLTKAITSMSLTGAIYFVAILDSLAYALRPSVQF